MPATREDFRSCWRRRRRLGSARCCRARASMSRVHRRLAAAFATVCLLGPTAAQTPLSTLPAGFDSVLVVRDVLPSLQAALESEALQTALIELPFLSDRLAGAGVNVEVLRAALHLYERQIPREVVVAAPPQAITAVAHLWGAFMALVVLSTDTDDDVVADRLEAHVTALADLMLVGHVRLRDEATAKRWFGLVTDTLDALPVDDALSIATTGDTLEVSIEPLRLGDGRLLARIGLADLPAKLPLLRWALKLERDGPMLTIRVGPGAPGELDAATLGHLWRNTPEQLFFARLNAAAAATVLDDVETFMEENEDAIDDLVEREPRLRLMLESLSTRFSDLDPMTTQVLNLTARGLELLDNTEFAMSGDLPALPPSGMLGYVDPELTAFGAANLDLDLLANVLLEQWRDQIVARAARAEMAKKDAFAVRALTFFDAALLPLQEFFAGEASACFAAGTLLVLEGTSEVASITVTSPAGEVTATHAGMRLPAFAMLGRLAEGADPWQFAQACSVNALAALGPVDKPLLLTEVDLGLGVPTRVVPWAAWSWGGRSVTLAGDVQPHWFVHAGSLAFSSSPTLSRRLLARHGAKNVAPPTGVVGWWRCSGAALAQAVDHLAATVLALADPTQAQLRAALGVDLDATQAQVVRQVRDVLVALARRVELIEMQQRFDGPIYSDRITLTWARR